MDKEINKLHDVIFNRIPLEQFVISSKLFKNGYFEISSNRIMEIYKDYVSVYHLGSQSVSKNMGSFFNLYFFKHTNPYCLNITEIEIPELTKKLSLLYSEYKSQNKYSSLETFKKNEPKITTLKQQIEYIKDVISKGKLRHDDKLDNGENLYLDTSRSYRTFYTSKLNQFEILEYLNIVNKTIDDFNPEPEKHPFKNPPYQYCIIAQLFATNEIIFKDDLFHFKNEIYINGDQLNTAIGKHYKRNFKFTQIINDTIQRNGDRNLFDKPKYLKIIKSYFEKHNIEVVNIDFREALKDI